MLNRDVVTGQIVAPSCGPTRTEADFLAHMTQTVATDPAATCWHFIVDNLNIHCSESLVRWVAVESGLTELDLGEKGKRGILASMESRAAFLSDPSHTIGFHYTPSTVPGSIRSRSGSASWCASCSSAATSRPWRIWRPRCAPSSTTTIGR